MTSTARALGIGCALLLAVPLGWFAAWATVGERVAAVGVFTHFAHWTFLPVVVVAGVAIARRSIRLGAPAALALVIFLAMWGARFVPRAPEARGPVLSVMTYNVLGFSPDVASMVKAIRAEDADVVLLQELNPSQAEAIERDLASTYPYRVLDARPGVTGMGALSKVPLARDDGPPIPGRAWVGQQVLHLKWHGRRVAVLNIHMTAMTFAHELRREEARAVAERVRALKIEGPVIVAGDANTTDRTEAQAILREELEDAWHEAGFGFGGTFPGSDGPGSSRPRVFGIAVPRWLVRIDYVMHSPDFAAVSARTARSDGGSDHRGVVAELALARGWPRPGPDLAGP